MSNTDDQRAAFEAWASLHAATHRIARRGDGVYMMWATQLSWLAWQAAIEHAKKTMCNRS